MNQRPKQSIINEGTLLPVSLVVILVGAIVTMTRTMADVNVHEKEITSIRKEIIKERESRERISRSLMRLEAKLGTLPENKDEWP